MLFKNGFVEALCILGFIFYWSDVASAKAEDRSCEGVSESDACHKIGNKYYLIDENAKANWFQADRSCRRQNATLATIQNDAEFSALSEHLNGSGDHKGGPYFISANDLGSEGTFYSNSDGNLVPFTRWAKNQPDNGAGGPPEDCVVIEREANSFAMNDLVCRHEYHYICEIQLSKC